MEKQKRRVPRAYITAIAIYRLFARRELLAAKQLAAISGCSKQSAQRALRFLVISGFPIQRLAGEWEALPTAQFEQDYCGKSASQ